MHSGGYSSDINDYDVIEDVGRGKHLIPFTFLKRLYQSHPYSI